MRLNVPRAEHQRPISVRHTQNEETGRGREVFNSCPLALGSKSQTLFMSCKTLLNMSLSLQLLPHLSTTFSHTGLLSVFWICQAPFLTQTFTAFLLFPGSYLQIPPLLTAANTYIHPADLSLNITSQTVLPWLPLSVFLPVFLVRLW